MLTVNHLNEVPPALRKKNCVLTVGVFDGVHQAHQNILHKLIQHSREHAQGISVVYTFRQHPLRFLAPDAAPPQLASTSEKLDAFEALGIDLVILEQFNRKLSQIDGRDFVIQHLLKHLNIKEIIVGHDHTFGRKSSGNVHLLKQLGKEYGFTVSETRPICHDSKPISSSYIRELISEGKVDIAGKLLGRPYYISGKVVMGKQIGRTIGFPTANILSSKTLIPPNGVYAVQVELSGKLHPGVMNIGNRPTFNGQDRSLEVHLLDFSKNIYKRYLKIHFMYHLRSENKFSTVEKLKAQINTDSQIARKLLSKP